MTQYLRNSTVIRRERTVSQLPAVGVRVDASNALQRQSFRRQDGAEGEGVRSDMPHRATPDCETHVLVPTLQDNLIYFWPLRYLTTPRTNNNNYYYYNKYTST